MPGARVVPGAHIQKLVVQRSGPQRVDWGALIHRVKVPDLFCCEACRDLFMAAPQKYLRLTKGVIVCPNCLGEKPPDHSGPRPLDFA